MVYQSTLTQKGQVTIPVEIRRFLGLEPYGKVTFTRVKDQIVITPAKSFLDLEGSIKSNIKYSDEEADKAVLRYIKEEYEKENT